MALPRPTFKGTYEGKNIWSYKGKLDYSIEDLNERISMVNKLLNIVQEGDYNFSNDLFWKEVWDTGVCKSELNKTDFLWSETNVAKTLEGIANYILALDTDENKTEYKIYKDEKKFNDALGKEKNAINKFGDDLSMDGKTEFKILIPNGNYKLDPKPSIKKSDLKRFKLLNDYQNYLEYLSELLKDDDKKSELLKILKNRGVDKYKNESSLYGFLVNTSGEVKKDMVKAKELLELPIKWKQPLKDGGYKSYEELDMFDKEHVLELLRVHRDMEIVDFQDDLNCILFDLTNLINECEFTSTQCNVLNMYSRGITQDKIADSLNIKQPVVNQHLNAIVNKIIKQYELHFMDWYYLNKCYGKYKSCNQCGEVKLIQYFNKNGDYYRTQCKKCQKK